MASRLDRQYGRLIGGLRRAVQVWNMQTGQQHDLPGHQAEVLALATTAGMLFSAGKDHSIRAWQFDAASGTFRPTVRAPSCISDAMTLQRSTGQLDSQKHQQPSVPEAHQLTVPC